MSLALAKSAMKTAMLAMANNEDDEQAADAAIDTFLDELVTLISSGQLTIPIGGVVVVGSAATQNNPAPIIVDNSLS